MRAINNIVIHCADTPTNMDIGAAEIRDWHVNDRGWSDIGYHYVIRRNGALEAGRPLERTGAHVSGHNADSIGICWVGGYKGIDSRTIAQRNTMKILIELLLKIWPKATVKGHRDFAGVTKTCPSFDVAEWIKELS